MAIFYTDTGSFGEVDISGSASNILNVMGSGSAIFTLSGSAGGLLEVGDIGAGSQIFAIASGSIDVFSIDRTANVIISGSLLVSASISSPTINLLSNEISIIESVINNVSALEPGGAPQTGLQNAVNALSNRISSIPGAASAQPTRYISVANTAATAVLTGISGLTVSVSAGVIYQIQGQIMYSVSAATGNAFGLIWPTANRVAGVWQGGISVNEIGASTFSAMAYGNFDTGDSNSAVWSAVVGAVGLHFIKVDAVIDVQTGGALYPVARSSAATNTMVFARGSFFKIARIN